MEEFLFEDSLLESMEIVSFEERDIYEVIRENAHALLDAQMDMEEILYENNIIVLEASGDKKGFIRRMLDKIKQYIKKFKDWIMSLLRKKKDSDKQQTKNNNSSTDTDEKNNDKKVDMREMAAKYNKVIETETVIFEVADSEKILREYQGVVSTLKNIINTIRDDNYSDDKVEQMFDSIEIPDLKTFKKQKGFKLKDFIIFRDAYGAYSLGVSVSQFGEEISELMTALEQNSDTLQDLIHGAIMKTTEERTVRYLQKITQLLSNITSAMSDAVRVVTRQSKTLGPEIESYEASLRKKYNLE